MPLFNVDLPDCFKNLILSCYVEDQTKRLSFDQIVDLLKTNHEFIDGKINVHEYLMYVRLIDNCFRLTKIISKNLQNIQNKQDNFNIQNKQDDLNIQRKQDDLNIQSKQDNQRDQYNNESINLYSQKRYMDLNITLDSKFIIDVTDYVRLDLIGKGGFPKVLSTKQKNKRNICSKSTLKN